ncbi:glycosyltransferase family 2 protein [Paenibacillus donghaensis]|uniref:Glycosyltransferase 2-like domain-containing protein n=1 Tax=Paenibacillus donghaensis TaxID=414771 RepID=A0A2Z2KI66_9BACL|nr:glycosyltransferase [Paenibacillus donghaensis]ASA23805.1 hypothetical protein B9T62_25295 [Paenibacillus donghaensis]
MQDKYIISIIIPTKNRTEYALKTVEQILSISDTDIQLVLQDNSDTNELEEFLKPFLFDSRLKYNYTSEVLSFVDNFSLGVSLADGEYICIIGDDDGINPEIVKVARWASKNDVKAIKPEVQAIYFWPDNGISFRGGNENSGYMSISSISGNVKISKTKSELVKLLNNGCQKYLALDLVKLYHGLVKKSCMEEVKSETGVYFGGLSPDIYSAVALSIVIPEVISIKYPLTISGICKKSGSADSATGKHTGELKDAPHFRGHLEYNWADEVPRFYSVETIWADSSLAAVRDMKKKDLFDEFKLEYLTIYCLIKYNEFSDIIKRHYTNNSRQLYSYQQKKNLILAYLKAPTRDFINRVLNRLTRKRGDFIKLYDIRDIIQAEKAFSNYLTIGGLNVESIITEMELKYNEMKN